MAALALGLVGLSLGACCTLVIGRLYRARGKARLWEEVDPFEFTRRSEAAQIRFAQVYEEAQRCADPDRLALLEAESVLILNNVRQLRLEQIECQENGWRRRREPAALDPRTEGR